MCVVVYIYVCVCVRVCVCVMYMTFCPAIISASYGSVCACAQI